MSEALLVCLKIVAMFLVMAVGYFCRRRGPMDAQTTSSLSRLCTDVTLPALIFMQMIETVDVSAVRVGWPIPLLASVGICSGFATGWITWRLFAKRSQAPVFIFASGMSKYVVSLDFARAPAQLYSSDSASPRAGPQGSWPLSPEFGRDGASVARSHVRELQHRGRGAHGRDDPRRPRAERAE